MEKTSIILAIVIAIIVTGCISNPSNYNGASNQTGNQQIAAESQISCSGLIFAKTKSGVLCKQNVTNATPAVIAVSGWGATATSTEGICRYFAAKGWICLAVDSAGDKRSEDEVVADIKSAVDTLESYSNVDKTKIILWGGSNGAYTTLVAASQRRDIFAEAATSPPLFYSMDKETRFKLLENLSTNVIYVFAEQDYTDEETARKVVEIVTNNGKKGEYKMIPNAGHEICCGVPEILDIQYSYIEGLIVNQTT